MGRNSNIVLINPSDITGGIFYFRHALTIVFLLLFSSLMAQPKLVIEETKKNFGTVKRGEIIKNEYEITNQGSEPLILTNAEVPCSCTTTEFSKEPIMPGHRRKVLVIFNTTTVYGRQDRTVLLHSNDPKSPVKLRYKGTVSEKN